MAHGQHFEDRPQDDLIEALDGHFEHPVAINVHKQGVAAREAAVVLGARQPRQSTEQCRFAKVTQPNDGHAVATGDSLDKLSSVLGSIGDERPGHNLQFRLKWRGKYRSCPVHRGQIEPGPSTVCLYYLIRRRLATTIKLTRPSAANPTSARLPGLARPVAM